MGQVQTPHIHHNESYVHWTIHGVYPIGTAAIIVHIDSFNGRNEEFKEPLQQRLQWMTSPHRPPLTHRDSSQDHFLHIAEPYQRQDYMCGSFALCGHKLLLEHADTLADHPELTPQRMRLVCNENCK